MDEHTRANLEWFFKTIEPIEAVYQDPEFSYLIHRSPQGAALVTARLQLQPITIDQPHRVVEAGNFYGYVGHLRALHVTPRQLLEKLLEGCVPGLDRTWRLTPGAASGQLFRTPLRKGVPQQQKTYELSGFGLGIHYTKTDDDEWSVRAGSVPYSDLNDLLADLKLPPSLDCQFHMVAYPPLVIDPTSRVRGETAELKLFRSKHLPLEKLSLNIVVPVRNAATRRECIDGSRFVWETASQSGEVLAGTVQIEVPKNSLIHCLAIYDRDCLHHSYISDPDLSHNPLKAIYELYDPGFSSGLSMLIQNPNGGKPNAHEAAVASLLWVLGFAPLHSGANNSDAPDVIAVSHDGNILVIECTLNDLQTKEKKPQKLIERTNIIRAILEKSNASSMICIPVMITSRKQADVLQDIEDCEKKGIVVFTQDDVQSALQCMNDYPKSSVRFMEVKQRLDRAFARLRDAEQERLNLTENVEELKRSFSEVRRLN